MTSLSNLDVLLAGSALRGNPVKQLTQCAVVPVHPGR
jgi:hypothetical protein